MRVWRAQKLARARKIFPKIKNLNIFGKHIPAVARSIHKQENQNIFNFFRIFCIFSKIYSFLHIFT